MSTFLSQLEAVFGWMVEASWQASVLAMVVGAMQWVLGARLSARWRYALWLLVVVRLVLPVQPESALSLFQFAPPPPAALTVSVTEPLFVNEVPPTASIPVAVPEQTVTISVYSLLAIGWLAGAMALLMATVMVNWRFARQVGASPEIDDPEIVRLFTEVKAEFGLRRAIRLVESGQVQSPAIMGLFRPALLLPADVRTKFDTRELRFIFLHELAHLKRGDVLVQALIAALQILHWFNPVLWLAFRRMRIDREPATDALVLSRAGEEEKERYGLMLIKLLEHFNQRHSLATLVGILEDKDQFKRRFSLIAKFTRGAYGWSLLGVAILAALALAGLTQAERAVFKRDPALPFVVDLKRFYNRVYADPTGADSTFKGYAGSQTIDGLPFDIGGQVELYGKEKADHNKDLPETVEGIKIDRKFDELHLVHAVEWREYYGCPVATIRLNYADGTKSDSTIRFNQQVNDWSRLYTEDAEVIDDPGTKIIWRGRGAAEGVGRLFKSVISNPFPEKKVATMDLISTKSGCSYMLIAATVAQREPGREVTSPMALLPARNFAGQVKFHIVDKKTGAPIAGAEIYPAMIIGDISLAADNALTGDDGSAVVKYPKDGEGAAKDLRVRVVRAGYQNCEIHWESGWNAGEIPEEITYRLTHDGDTAADNSVPDFTVTTSAHPTVLGSVRQGDAAGLQKLIDEGTEIPKVDDKGEPLIFLARTAAVAELLLNHGADAKAQNKQKEPVINFMCRNGGGEAATIVEVLLKHGADPNSREGEPGETTLMEAQDGKTVDVLLAHSADPTIKGPDGMGLLDRVGRLDVLEALLRHGVAIDPRTDGASILLQAAIRGNVPVVKAMLDRGVDPNQDAVFTKVNGKPVMMKPLPLAVSFNRAEAVTLLLDRGAKPDGAMDVALANRQAKMATLLWGRGVRTISELNYDVSQRAPVGDVQKLLDSGVAADPQEDAKSLFSPLAIAAQLGELDTVKLLVARGADVNKGAKPHPDYPPDYITSPLAMAASEKQVEVVQFLLDHGAKPSVAALWEAAENSTSFDHQRPSVDFEKCMRILIDAGALKGATAEEQGHVLGSVMGTRQGQANEVVLKILLDTGVSPEVPMPYIAENGGKPNSVIGYDWEYYAKNKDDPRYSWMIDQIKPMLDMLEAADKVGDAQTIRPVTLSLALPKVLAPVTNAAPLSASSQPSTFTGGTVIVTPKRNAQLDPDALQKEELSAKEDADARRVLLNSVKDLPDDKFVATLAGLGRTSPEMQALEIELNQKPAALDEVSLTYSASHPKVIVAQAALEATQARMKELTDGIRRAMTIDLQMADARVVVLSEELNAAKGAGGASPAADASASNATGELIEISCRVAEVKEDVYEADREKIDAAVKRGDLGYLNNLQGMSLLSAPSVTTQPGLQATIEVVREFAFPVNFDWKNGVFVPKDFAEKNCGVTAKLTPMEVNGKVRVAGSLSLTTFEGFTFNGDSNTKVGSPTFRTTESYVFEEMDNGEQIKGVMIPGIQNEPPTKEELTGAAAMVKAAEGVPERLMVFLSAKRISAK